MKHYSFNKSSALELYRYNLIMIKGDYIILNKPYKICIHVENNDTRVYKKGSSLISLEWLWVISHVKVLLSWFYNQLEVIKCSIPITTEKYHIYPPGLQPNCISQKKKKKYLFPNKPAMWTIHWDILVGGQSKVYLVWVCTGAGGSGHTVWVSPWPVTVWTRARRRHLGVRHRCIKGPEPTQWV